MILMTALKILSDCGGRLNNLGEKEQTSGAGGPSKDL